MTQLKNSIFLTQKLVLIGSFKIAGIQNQLPISFGTPVSRV